MPAQKLENLLKSGRKSSLEKIIRTAQDMDALTGALQQTLAPDIAVNIIAANLRADGELVVICASSAWASRVRFETDALLAAADKAGFRATSLRVSITRQ